MERWTIGESEHVDESTGITHWVTTFSDGLRIVGLLITIGAIEWKAQFLDREDERRAVWYIYRGAEKIGTVSGAMTATQVVNVIKHFLAR